MPRTKNAANPELSPPRANTSTSTPTLTSRLHELVSACFTGIWIQTQEPHEAAREITALCRQENWRLGVWNCDSGIQFPIEQLSLPGVTETQDPLAVIRAMPQVAQGSGTTVLLFENLHRFMGCVELIQAVARQAIWGKHNRAFIVVLAPVTQIPPELDKLFVCVLTAVENGGAGTVSRRSKMAAHNRAGIWEGGIGATAPIPPPFRERHRSALRHGDLERDTA
jgi:hypothetical protein